MLGAMENFNLYHPAFNSECVVNGEWPVIFIFKCPFLHLHLHQAAFYDVAIFNGTLAPRSAGRQRLQYHTDTLHLLFSRILLGVLHISETETWEF
jgi:hypothetical protein